MKWTRTLTLLLGLSSLFLVAPGALALDRLDRDAALGSQGELYQLHSGLYKDLFPTGNATDPAALVLALDITRPDADPQRLLVPETEGAEEESLPALVYEDESHSVFLLWASKINAIHTIFKLASYDGTRFSDPIDVAGNPWAVKNSPQIAITHDSYEDPTATGQTVTRRRTILHLAWEEEKDGGSFGTFYTPIVLEDGVYLGWNPVYPLNDYFDSATAALAAAPVPVALMRSPALQAGRDGSTVVLAFSSPRSGRLLTVEVDSLPRELVRLAETTRATIIDTGLRLSYPANLRDLASQVKATIIARGTAFHPEVVATLADRIYTQIVTTGGSSQTLTALAGATRATIIDTGFKLSGRGLRPANQDLPAARTFEFSRVAGPIGTPVGLSNVLQFRMASSRPAPAGVDGPARLFMSETGDDVVVSWPGDHRILYRDSSNTGWSDVRELRLSANLDEQHAYDILAQRVHSR